MSALGKTGVEAYGRESLAPCLGLTGASWERWDARTCRALAPWGGGPSRAGSDSDKGSIATVTDVLLFPESLGCTAGKSFGGSLDLWI